MRTHGAAARRGKSVGLARLRIPDPDCVLSIPTHFRTRKEETRQQKEARPGIAA